MPLVDREGMGRKIHPKFKSYHFASRKYTYQLIVYYTKTYLMQMHDYCTRNSSTPAIESSKSTVHSVPSMRGQVPPMRFQVKHPTHETKTSLQEFTIDAEYWMYTSGHLNKNTDILKFWEVRFMFLGSAMTHILSLIG